MYYVEHHRLLACCRYNRSSPYSDATNGLVLIKRPTCWPTESWVRNSTTSYNTLPEGTSWVKCQRKSLLVAGSHDRDLFGTKSIFQGATTLPFSTGEPSARMEACSYRGILLGFSGRFIQLADSRYSALWKTLVTAMRTGFSVSGMTLDIAFSKKSRLSP
ncbi:hypothetical protein RvY_06940 [Ramazzottius varieornatus]|uniref:Uncharacterized protein n=1 Tax=Ramazzottius varieornatus TaxID=947166 RepID=A0A1D1V0B5_RAMVA|nr:hypothetical protein RvY_06940 [Ramazzottius varieornatus]